MIRRLVNSTFTAWLLCVTPWASAVLADDPLPTTPTDPIDLTHWKLTLPVDAKGSTAGQAAEISAAGLASGYADEFFHIDSHRRLVFWCPVNGATTEGTEFPRSELREMLDKQQPAVNWTSQGTHVMTARCRVLEVPSYPKVVIGQIHGYPDKAKPLIKLQYFKGRVEALVKISPNAGKDRKLTFAEVGLNQEIAFEIKVQDGVLWCTVNGLTQTQDLKDNDAAWAEQTFYFKAGAYPQDNSGDAQEGARVVFSSLHVTHSQLGKSASLPQN